jgi:hypothetical protein
MRGQRLADLEQKLRSLSHNEEAIQEVQRFSSLLAGTKERLAIWNTKNAILRRPIETGEVAALGFNTPDDAFTMLQGDVIRTEAAYFLGERVTGRPKYAILNSSCDLVPGRSSYAALVRIVELRRDEEKAKEKLGTLLKFTRRDSMYLPVLPDDGSDVIGNVIQFDGICQIRSSELLLSHRLASLSLVGWRIFASFVRTVIARANPREVLIRSAIEAPLTAPDQSSTPEP